MAFIATFSGEKVSESLEDGTVVPHLETDAIFGFLERAQEIDPVDAECRLRIPRDWKMFDVGRDLLLEEKSGMGKILLKCI